jgi:Cysteine rich repeat
MNTTKTIATALALSTAFATGALAQNGPVATACSGDIPKFCAGKEHGQGEVRGCLEANKDKVSAACKTALETTRGGS